MTPTPMTDYDRVRIMHALSKIDYSAMSAEQLMKEATYYDDVAGTMQAADPAYRMFRGNTDFFLTAAAYVEKYGSDAIKALAPARPV